MYLEPFFEHCHHFTTLVYLATEKQLSSALADKLDWSYSEMVRWVRQQTVIAVVHQEIVFLCNSGAPKYFVVKPIVLDGALFTKVLHLKNIDYYLISGTILNTLIFFQHLNMFTPPCKLRKVKVETVLQKFSNGHYKKYCRNKCESYYKFEI